MTETNAVSTFHDTKNRLEDFDLALAICEDAVSYQLKEAWKLWTARDDGTYPLHINPLKPNGKKSKTVLDAALGTPRLEFLADGPTTVRVSFPIVSGTIEYDDEGDDIKVDLGGKVLSFTSNIDKQNVSIADLYRWDKVAGERVQEVISSLGQGEGAFSIECLFLHLTSRNIIYQHQMEGTDITTAQRVAGCLAVLFEQKNVTGAPTPYLRDGAFA